MNFPPSRTSSRARLRSGRSGAYCAFTSTSGIGRGVTGIECNCVVLAFPGAMSALTRSSSARRRLLDEAPASSQPPQREPAGEEDDGAYDEVVEVAECVVDVLPAGAGRPAATGKREAPDSRAYEREKRVADERCLHDARGDRDERAHDRGQSPEEDRPVLPALEPSFRPVEPFAVEVEPAAATFQVR